MVSSSVKKRAVFLRGIPSDVIRETKALAARQGTTLSAFVVGALERAIHETSTDPERTDDLSSEMEWYERNRGRLARDFKDQYVAIVDHRVVDHHKDFQTLAKRVFEKFGVRSIFMPRVSSGPSSGPSSGLSSGPGPAPVHVRSPRISRSR